MCDNDRVALLILVGRRISGYGLRVFFFSSRRRHTRFDCDWSSDVCSSDLPSSTCSSAPATSSRWWTRSRACSRAAPSASCRPPCGWPSGASSTSCASRAGFAGARASCSNHASTGSVRSAGLSIGPRVAKGTLSREAQVDFTNLTFVDGASLLVTAASDIQRPAQLAGKRIAVVQTSTTERVLGETLKRFSITNATIFAVKDHPEALTALEDGKIDVYASDRVILAGLRAGARDPAKLVLLDDYLSYEPYAFVVRRNDSSFRLAVNRVLARLYRSAEVVPIYEKWFGPMPEGGLIPAVFALQSVPE